MRLTSFFSRLTFLVVPVGLFWLIRVNAFPSISSELVPAVESENANDEASGSRIDDWFQESWKTAGISPAEQTDDLTVFRRLSLALHGTIPSLEEIQRFQADSRPERLRIWCSEMLRDSRFADYWCERLTRVFVGTQQEPFLVFRRDRFRNWIADQLRENRPYDELVRGILSQTGLWTGEPATNFVTHAYIDEEFDENKLAGKTVRAVLGQRIDCAQCHDHPFADWKQTDFEGLAAFYGQTNLSVFGITDDATRQFTVQDRETQEDRTVEPNVPFLPELVPEAGTRRQQLAQWCTHPDNRRFARATVNRVWALMFGKAFSEGAPYYTRVDDLPDPEGGSGPGTALDLLADEFVRSGFDLRQLIQTIASLEVYRLSSHSVETDADRVREQVAHWAVFPLVRLRPEQLVGSMIQAASIKTIDQNSHLLTRLIKLVNENDFLKEYGDLGADELEPHSGSIPQGLLRMNGKLFEESIKPNPFNATPRIALLSGSPSQRLENCFLTCLSRKPTAEEADYFLNAWSEEDDSRTWPQRVQDLYWQLVNSPEFSWNH